MAFDASETLKNMIAAANDVFAAESPKIKDCVERALKDQEKALVDIAAARVTGDLTDDDMQSELEDERKTLEAALLACEVKTKAAAQQAANAAFKVLEKAIKAAL
jgi:DNA-binding transcriptional regulator GbsR (MarR family)